MFWPILQFSTLTEGWQQNTAVVQGLLSAAELVLDFLIKNLTFYILNMSQSCVAQNIIFISCFHLGHSIHFYKLRNCNKKWQNISTWTVVGFFPFKRKFRLIWAHTYKEFSVLSELHFQKRKKFLWWGKHRIISIPLCLTACQLFILPST